MEGSKSELWTELELFYAHIYVERRMSSVEIWALFILLPTKQFEGIFLIWKACQAGNKSVLKKLVSKQTLFFCPHFLSCKWAGQHAVNTSCQDCICSGLPFAVGLKIFHVWLRLFLPSRSAFFQKVPSFPHAFNMQNPRQFCFHLAKWNKCSSCQGLWPLAVCAVPVAAQWQEFYCSAPCSWLLLMAAVFWLCRKIGGAVPCHPFDFFFLVVVA